MSGGKGSANKVPVPNPTEVNNSVKEPQEELQKSVESELPKPGKSSQRLRLTVECAENLYVVLLTSLIGLICTSILVWYSLSKAFSTVADGGNTYPIYGAPVQLLALALCFAPVLIIWLFLKSCGEIIKNQVTNNIIE